MFNAENQQNIWHFFLLLVLQNMQIDDFRLFYFACTLEVTGRFRTSEVGSLDSLQLVATKESSY